MRIAALLVVGVGFLCAAACTATTSPDEDCIKAGGLCFTSKDPAGCGSTIQAACIAGYTCCSPVNASNIVDGAVIVDVKIFFDTGRDAAADAAPEAGHEAGPEAKHDSSVTDAAGSSVRDGAKGG